MKILAVSAIAVSMLGFANVAQAADKLFIDGDMVRGAQRGAPGPACVLNNQFKHLEKVVWRMRVRDADGKPLDDKGLKSVTVEVSNGQKVQAPFGPHPPMAGHRSFLVGHLDHPTGYPNGSLTCKVTATDTKGESATWEPFNRSTTQQVQAGRSRSRPNKLLGIFPEGRIGFPFREATSESWAAIAAQFVRAHHGFTGTLAGPHGWRGAGADRFALSSPAGAPAPRRPISARWWRSATCRGLSDGSASRPGMVRSARRSR